ncbi:cytochrome c oxidase subunit II [Paenibacillus sp. MWE-103]|uniref:Cytochrome c oxidase subunit 2 n=1 Tax=Paenibacillus artemisiicola TaxID=1172618 RepID=A0ABS3WH99_9BACL|nr:MULTISPECIES: cytochrome c oxidase subunit II [Paenibacillus]MBO7747667.1 cytochrome c oxidase subunit II [Paenibacillus artemisiicola]SFJ51089.1 cytochrome c oxidase subunit 2 [Paenibacillus sp. UNC496MF]
MMNRWHVLKRLLPLLAGMVLLLSACGRADLSTLRPQGPVAEEQFGLMKLTITIMVIVVLVVFAIAGYVILRYRRRPGDKSIPVQVEGNHKLEIIWTVIPIVLLIIIGIPTVNSVFGLAKDYTKDPNAIQINVTAHQYWWEFEYPKLGVKTAQELLIPEGTIISVEAKTADVLHSFWIPSLAGKTDTNPGGNVNTMYFKADHTGVFLGKCAELCGPSHSLMDFKVKVVDKASFDRWVAAMKNPVALPQDQEVADLLNKQCLSCHAIGGNGGPAFPNLTGIGGRQTVAGILVNTDDPKYKNEGTVEHNLEKWISDPQAVKPGTLMPKVDLTQDQVKAIAKYLAGLKLDY